MPGVHLLQIGQDLHWWNSHTSTCDSFATLSCFKTALVGSASPGKYFDWSCNSREQSRTWLKSMSGVHNLQIGQDLHWWNSHTSTCYIFANLYWHKTTLVGSLSPGRYFDWSCNSREQSRTCLKSISGVHLLQIGQDLHWWNSHTSTRYSLANLYCHKTTLVGSTSPGRYFDWSRNSRNQSRTRLKSISGVDLLQIG